LKQFLNFFLLIFFFFKFELKKLLEVQFINSLVSSMPRSTVTLRKNVLYIYRVINYKIVNVYYKTVAVDLLIFMDNEELFVPQRIIIKFVPR